MFFPNSSLVMFISIQALLRRSSKPSICMFFLIVLSFNIIPIFIILTLLYKSWFPFTKYLTMGLLLFFMMVTLIEYFEKMALEIIPLIHTI